MPERAYRHEPSEKGLPDDGRRRILSWETESVEVTQASHIVHNGFDTNQAGTSLTAFLGDVIGRTRKSADAAAATAQLCHPVLVGVFRYTDTLRGLGNTLERADCGIGGSQNSGATFIDNAPDEFW